MKLIDKDALVAEIERLDALYHTSKNLTGDLFIQGLFSFIDTLEVKEVDLEHEVESYWKQCDMTWCKDAYSMMHIRSILSDIAKHFYELGMAASNKTQKGEEV